jgi:hypothetical protein
MAIIKNYALMDKKAGTFLKPLSFTTDDDCVRWVKTVVNDDPKKQLPAAYPEDYAVYRLSDYDDIKGMYLQSIDGKAVNHPKQLAECIEFKRREKATLEPETVMNAIQDLDAQIEVLQRDTATFAQMKDVVNTRIQDVEIKLDNLKELTLSILNTIGQEY